ncbi:FAD-dependent oxidoreductase [Phreatobacter sp.]|uniref:FAD-dependent oxidoreductase n=1 Tax=Phreatobacter sp. TaxID=1966341 RepID=UPI003F6FDF81
MSATVIRTVAVIGAGPVGLAAAAHLLERGLKPVVLEAGAEAGHAMRQWAHVQLFSPWEFNVDRAAERLLQPTGWVAPEPGRYPTGGEMIEGYVAPLAAALGDHVRTDARVVALGRRGFDKVKTAGRGEAPFELRLAGGEVILADAVIDTSGTWDRPGPSGANGLPVIGEAEAAGRIAYGMPDVLGAARARYAGRQVAVLGAGHSALGTLLDLARLMQEEPGTRITWLVRGADPAKSFGGGANDALAARGELGTEMKRLAESGGIAIETRFGVERLREEGGALIVTAADGRSVAVDELVVATGFRPDLSFLSELRFALDPALECPPLLAPLIDPNVHSCGSVRPHGARELAQPEPGLYLAGMKSYGRAPTFLMLTGYEQVRSIAAELAGDHEAARRVELVLPETGVCSTSRGPAPAEAACCGGPAKVDATACCAADETARRQGASGCGCGTTAPQKEVQPA